MRHVTCHRLAYILIEHVLECKPDALAAPVAPAGCESHQILSYRTVAVDSAAWQP